ncbi:hypothetical protein G6F56_001596 [Rhizopus delemar]|uniref:RING-type domain-containing protein n=1 Tax=Rhizopus stolonifer TaxID=4846 RepID=A0A367KYF1_RHIST|nr:hypothetical protein G6F56_001596 [Rhizopus delemar]RCI07204.1 hypothetical protein CU098_008610 [Rhizopus stolonifer]
MNTSLVCSACQNVLSNPITLSCGYTLCQECLPITTDDSFVCPVTECEQERHLFGPSLHQDQLITQLLQNTHTLICSAGDHTLDQPVTNHCGHTFCRLCLLERKIQNSSCLVCQMRLPSYNFIQNQPDNHLLQSLLTPIEHEPLLSQTTQIPTLLLDFCILPTQRLRLPTPQNLAQTLITDPSTQSLYLPVLCSPSTTGTLVKITNCESQWIEVLGVQRFTMTEEGLRLIVEEDGTDNRVADRIHDFIQGLAQCAPSTSFCNAAAGLLGPVWLNSVQDLHGPLPKDPVNLCWWAAIVLPVGNAERVSLLEIECLKDRLALILNWIEELQVQSDQNKPMEFVQV